MNSQYPKQSRNPKNKRNIYNETSWNNIKELINARKIQKKKAFEERFSNVITLINKKSVSLHREPIKKTVIATVPKNIESGEVFCVRCIDGKYFRITAGSSCIKSGSKISFQINYNRNTYEEIKELINIRKRYSKMYKLGSYYGYPKCCINDFVMRKHNNKESKPIQEFAGICTGYVPCLQCSEKIISKKLSLTELIKNRKCKKVFPRDDEPGSCSPCKKHAILLILNRITIEEISN